MNHKQLPFLKQLLNTKYKPIKANDVCILNDYTN